MIPLTFGQHWASLLWGAMRKTGNGYHRPSLRNSGKGSDRRADKLDPKNQPALARRYRQRYTTV